MNSTISRRRLVGALAGMPLAAVALPRVALAAPPPESFDKFIVYMATGVFDPSDTSGAPSGDFFQREIMQRTTEEIAAELERAEQFFLARYGLDFTAVDEVDGAKTIPDVATLTTESFMFDPRNEYRAYVVSDTTLPDEGWVVRDGGWNVTMADGGATLTGEWGGEDGTDVPGGSFVVFGDYNINTSTEPIHIHYQSGSPIEPPGPNGIMAFSCLLTHDAWGSGLANGVVLPPENLGNGMVKVAIRNVLTFPGR